MFAGQNFRAEGLAQTHRKAYFRVCKCAMVRWRTYDSIVYYAKLNDY